jgi:hypothetical protein
MVLKQTLIRTLIIGIILVVGWELYWRSEGRVPNIDDNKELWATELNKIASVGDQKVVFIGSSRILFDTQKDIWRKHSEREPIMLGVQGATPLPMLRHIVEETDYKGLLIVGVAPDLFFWTNKEEDWSWNRIKTLIEYSKDRTYAQRINQHLSIPLQKSFAFYRDGDENWADDVDLKNLLKNARWGERPRPLSPPFYNFEEVSIDRNVDMSAKTAKDTALANAVIRAWGLDEWEAEAEDSVEFDKMKKDIEIKKNDVLNYFLKFAAQYTERGGTIVLVRCPSRGKYRELEQRDFPREHFWDSLVYKSKLPAIHFEDYSQLQGLNLPELSHLSKKDAEYFTVELIKILEDKGALTQMKTK